MHAPLSQEFQHARHERHVGAANRLIPNQLTSSSSAAWTTASGDCHIPA